MKDPVFTVGQQVVARFIGGYANHLTEGKVYTVTVYDPPTPTEVGFTFPAYVTVIGDWGKPVQSHTYRFHAAEQTGEPS